MMRPIKEDPRYTIALEYCGYPQPRWVAHWLGDWLGQDKDKSGAIMLCLADADKRDREMQP